MRNKKQWPVIDTFMMLRWIVFLFAAASFCEETILVAPMPGDEREFLAISRLKVEAGWNYLVSETKSVTSTYAVPRGWVILEIRVEIHEDRHGSRNTEGLSQDADVILESEIYDFYEQKIRAAAKVGNQEAVAELEAKRTQHLKIYNRYRSNINFVRATVTASGHGNMFTRERGSEDISVYVKCMYIGIPGRDLDLVHKLD